MELSQERISERPTKYAESIMPMLVAIVAVAGRRREARGRKGRMGRMRGSGGEGEEAPPRSKTDVDRAGLGGRGFQIPEIFPAPLTVTAPCAL